MTRCGSRVVCAAALNAGLLGAACADRRLVPVFFKTELLADLPCPLPPPFKAGRRSQDAAEGAPAFAGGWGR